MTPARARRARALLRALVALAAAVVLALAWASDRSGPATGPSAGAPVDLGPYALADTGFLGLRVNPPAPGNVRAEPHHESALVTWTAARPNTSTVVSYRVYVGGTLRTQVPGTQTSATVTGLANYQVSPQITVRTFDSDSTLSDASNSVTTVPYDDVPPAAVTGLVATRGDGKVTLTWEPESGVESDRAGVRVYVDGALRTSLPAATTAYDVTGLTNDREYTFYLIAYDSRPNGYGSPPVNGPNSSPPSATVRATPTDLTPPSTPTAFTAVRGDTTAALTWTAPPENDVGRYEVVDENGALVASFAAPATGGTATAMTNGRAYRLRLVAVDRNGNHSPATTEVAVTPAAPPIVRTGLVATRGDGRVLLAWDPPTGDPRFAAAASIRVLVDGVVRATITGTASSYTVDGLTNDVEHAFSLVAVDAEGRTSAETARVRATPTDLTPPSAPTTFAAKRGDTTAALTWTAPPEGDVGTYLVLSQDGSTLTTITAPATAHQLTGLANGTTYRLRLVAVDRNGNRSAPTGVVVVTPLAPPLAITGLTAATQGSKVDLAWDPPASAFGHEDAVQVQVWRAGSPDELLATVPAGQTSYRWTGYSPGSSESFHVVAIDADPRAAERSNVVSTVLAAPQDLAATVEDGATRITWSSVLGATGYRVERTGGGGPTLVGTAGPSDGPFLDVTGLTNGTAYGFRVLAVDDSRTSAPSADVSVTPLALPAVVRGLRAERQDPDVLVSWTAPATPASDVAATARVEVFRVGSPDVLLGTVDAPGTTFTAVSPGTDPRPEFYVVARDVHGRDPGGRASAASDRVLTALGVPRDVSGASGTTSATISWATVVGATGYRVERHDGSAWVAAGTTTATTLTVEGLAKVDHRFRVVATATGEESAASAEVTVRVGYTPPTTVPTGGSGGGIGVAASRDGRYAVLAVPGAGGRLDLVRVDRLAEGRTVIATGVPPQQPGLARTAVSEDGRHVAVITVDPHDPRDQNGKADVYRYDVAAGTWSWASAPTAGSSFSGDGDAVPGLADGTFTEPGKGPQVAITGDGSRVFFLSERRNLVAGDSGTTLDLFSTAFTSGSTTGTTTRITAPADDRPTSTGFAVTPSGSHVLYTTGLGSSRSLVRQTAVAGGAKVLVTGPVAGALNPLAGVGQMAISDDGQRVVAVKGAGPTVVQADLTSPTAPPAGAPAGTPSRVQAVDVVASDSGGGQVALSPDGTVAFVATKEALLAADTNGRVDVYRVALASPADPAGRVLVTAGPDGGSTTVAGESTSVPVSEWGAITARDADHVVVVTQRPLITADGNGVRDAYATDLSAAPADRSHPLVGAP